MQKAAEKSWDLLLKWSLPTVKVLWMPYVYIFSFLIFQNKYIFKHTAWKVLPCHIIEKQYE